MKALLAVLILCAIIAPARYGGTPASLTPLPLPPTIARLPWPTPTMTRTPTRTPDPSAPTPRPPRRLYRLRLPEVIHGQ